MARRRRKQEDKKDALENVDELKLKVGKVVIHADEVKVIDEGNHHHKDHDRPDWERRENKKDEKRVDDDVEEFNRDHEPKHDDDESNRRRERRDPWNWFWI
ncbi:hypothetical protein [Oceanobacillus senegalensis]|uniref:hypothetical protein n=1 Tax=Oceanobacillus senegalensis TaxID=1936063 RepID=UPI000A30B7B5|nr:hypothetical protein [Oceanobacillus senegalensis]